MKIGTVNFTCKMSPVLKNQLILPTRCREKALRSQTALQKSKNGVFLQKKSWGLIFLEKLGSERSQPIPGMCPWVPVGQIGRVADLNGMEPDR